MTRLPRPLQLFWSAYFLVLLGALLLTAWPRIGRTLFPALVAERVVELHRDVARLRLIWAGDTLRPPAATTVGGASYRPVRDACDRPVVIPEIVSTDVGGPATVR